MLLLFNHNICKEGNLTFSKTLISDILLLSKFKCRKYRNYGKIDLSKNDRIYFFYFIEIT